MKFIKVLVFSLKMCCCYYALPSMRYFLPHASNETKNALRFDMLILISVSESFSVNSSSL